MQTDMKATGKNSIKTKREDESSGWHSINEQPNMEHQMHSNSDFFNGNLPWNMHTQCIWQDNGKILFSISRLIQPLGSGGG